MANKKTARKLKTATGIEGVTCTNDPASDLEPLLKRMGFTNNPHTVATVRVRLAEIGFEVVQNTSKVRGRLGIGFKSQKRCRSFGTSVSARVMISTKNQGFSRLTIRPASRVRRFFNNSRIESGRIGLGGVKESWCRKV